MPRLVRRRSFVERVKAYLNPLDFLLWLSEEIETSDWDTKSVGNTIGLVLNVVFLLARANSGGGGGGGRYQNDDVFGDSQRGSGWLGWFAVIVVQTLTLFAVVNAGYTFLRKRHYRLFENKIDARPSTPNARRVRVDSSPVSSSPLRLLSSIIGETSAESRSHPDPTRDVWEVAIWDPLPICLRLFCLFSPGHVLVYQLFLPVLPSDPRPSTTIVTTIILGAVLSCQLLFLYSNFTSQIKDSAVIHKEVLHEYDTKFVHPRLNVPVRDVGVQFDAADSHETEIDTYPPTTVIRRPFRINPNPNYAKHISPQEPHLVPHREIFSTPLATFRTPQPLPAYARRESTPVRTPSHAPRHPPSRQSMGGVSSFSTSMSTSTSTNTSAGAGAGDGGSLGVYSHAASPLKKAISMYDMQSTRTQTPRNSLQASAREVAEERARAAERERERSRSPVKQLGVNGRESSMGNGPQRHSFGIPARAKDYY